MRFFDGPFEESQIPIQIWTDGACSGNPGSGGAAAIIRYSNSTVKEITFYEEQSTNQRMEIKAVIIAIAEILKTPHDEKNIEIYSDSAYVCNCINQEWYKKWFENGWINSKKEPVANKDLWENLFQMLNELEEDYQITFIKVKGHSMNTWNERADRLAVRASKGDLI
jgi:ribonuclease HI